MAKKDKDRIIKLFKSIEDPETQEIIANVVLVEQKNRTSSNERFPMRDIRDVIDAVARKKEMENN